MSLRPNQVCRQCGQPAAEQRWLRDGPYIWHNKCYNCELCGTKLEAGLWTERDDGRIVCSEHNIADEEATAPQRCCSECRKPLNEKGILWNSRYFHKTCFRCNDCKQTIQIDQWCNKDQSVYCRTCYDRRFPTLCCKCNCSLAENDQRILRTNAANFYCTNCFFCVNCKCPIIGENGSGDALVLFDDLYCTDCYDVYEKKRKRSLAMATGPTHSTLEK